MIACSLIASHAFEATRASLQYRGWWPQKSMWRIVSLKRGRFAQKQKGVFWGMLRFTRFLRSPRKYENMQVCNLHGWTYLHEVMPLFPMIFCFLPTSCSSVQVFLRAVVLKCSLIYSLVPEVTILKPPLLVFTYRKIRHENTVGNTLAFQLAASKTPQPSSFLLKPPCWLGHCPTQLSSPFLHFPSIFQAYPKPVQTSNLF